MPNFPDLMDVLADIGLRGAFYKTMVAEAREARHAFWTWPETDDLSMASLMGGPLDNMAVNHES